MTQVVTSVVSWERTQVLEKVGKNGLRFTLAGTIASMCGTLPRVMLAMRKTPEEIEADCSRHEGSAEDTDSSGDEGKSQSSSRKTKTPKGKGSFRRFRSPLSGR